MTTARSNETLGETCQDAHNQKTSESYSRSPLREKIIWRYALSLTAYHVVSIVALYGYLFGLYSVPIKFWTILWGFIVCWATGVGTTVGAHRLWSHRAFKANLPLRILLMILFSGSGVNPLYYWIRDHRLHHKYSETDADPHNSKRGFIFSHWGWLVVKRHPECLRQGRQVDMSDIEADPVVMFQKKYVGELRLLLCFVIPTAVPVLFWNETILHAVLTQCFIRYMALVNITMTINSVAHRWGNRPYNRSIKPADNMLMALTGFGEGSHNYHHTFPWDYKASELPYMNINLTTAFIRAMAKLGWAYDLREPSPELVEKIIRRIGHKSVVK